MLHIGYFASIRTLTGKKEEDVARTENVLALMQKLCDTYGKPFQDFCMDDDKISRNVNILVNGKHIQHLEGEATVLKDGDDVSIFPLIAGG